MAGDADSKSSFETLRPVVPSPQGPVATSVVASPKTWWDRYAQSISKLSVDTRAVVEDDARFIADRAAPLCGDGSIDPTAYGEDRIRTGIVVGSVQSGKTANMLAVAALLLDRGVDVLVVLAGTRVALWLQTYERLLRQLDGSTTETAWLRDRERMIVPRPRDILSGTERAAPRRYLGGPRQKVIKALSDGRPVLFVVPKEDDHLLALARHLEEVASAEVLDARTNPLRMVVLDDEADDASILEATDNPRITPQFIQGLWASEQSAPHTRHSRLLATYIAYTATPQANYLQATHNPLAPRSFHAALRVPSDRGARSPRTPTFHERGGLNSYYCGGDVYYERLRGLAGDPCVSTPFPAPQPGELEAASLARYASARWSMIGDAMRAYFVSGAMRLYAQGRRLSNVPTAAVDRSTLDRARPKTHTMLYHPSALKEVHFASAGDLARWSMSLPGDEEEVDLLRDLDGEPILRLDPAGLKRRMEAEEGAWQAWAQSYAATASALAKLPGGGAGGVKPAPWSEIRTLLIDEVFPFVKMRILNSDPRADDRPEFEPTLAPESVDLFVAPSDIYTIFIAGNVLSRGLTVEGLCTSLFLRGAREPAADTQMQMQRWFGYRGPHLAFCRVFLFQDQLELFRQYHQNDVALKTQILHYMDGHAVPFADGVLVLQGEAFRATAKVDSRRMPLHPGPTPSIRVVEPVGAPLHAVNIDVAERMLGGGTWTPLEFPVGKTRGLLREEPATMLEVAEFLESLRYTMHAPDPAQEIHQRWAHIQRTLKLDEPLFRPPAGGSGAMAVDPNGCPYTIAAYLRLWSVALQRHDLPGMFPTDRPAEPWNFIDLAAYRKHAPKFWLGVRFGSQGTASSAGLRAHHVEAMERGFRKPHLLNTLWGSRDPSETWFGDQAFDYHRHNPGGAPRLLLDGAWRRRGEPGLLLLHVVRAAPASEVVAVGLALPHGGPDHIAALRVEGD